jgi:tetratricopeptide (TPR) repeat protein
MLLSAGAIFVGCGILLMFALSHPAPLRKGRWLKMAVSLPVLLFLGWLLGFQPDNAATAIGNATFYVGGTVIFTLIWLNNFTWFSAEAVHRVVHGRPNQGGGGFVPDYRAARSRVEDGDYEQAIEYVQFELAKEAGNFEGLWLLAALHQELKQLKEARAALDRILACPSSTPEQVTTARAAHQQLRALEIQLASDRERK